MTAADPQAPFPCSPQRQRLPPWLRRQLAPSGQAAATRRSVDRHGLHTVCDHASCPNRNECYSRGTATFLILGQHCTRNCAFCDIQPATSPLPPPAADEPQRVAAAASELGLRHVVVTSVTRDDLADGGAGHFAATITALHSALPQATIEVLTPDFGGDHAALATVLAAGPTVFNHNLETVARLYPQVRPQAIYQRSLDLLRRAAELAPQTITKSGFMVGLGETDDEIRQLLTDLAAARVQAVTIGQYLRPSLAHHDILRFVDDAGFARYRQWASELGIGHIEAGSFVRSSYHADKMVE